MCGQTIQIRQDRRLWAHVTFNNKCVGSGNTFLHCKLIPSVCLDVGEGLLCVCVGGWTCTHSHCLRVCEAPSFPKEAGPWIVEGGFIRQAMPKIPGS